MKTKKIPIKTVIPTLEKWEGLTKEDFLFDTFSKKSNKKWGGSAAKLLGVDKIERDHLSNILGKEENSKQKKQIKVIKEWGGLNKENFLSEAFGKKSNSKQKKQLKFTTMTEKEYFKFARKFAEEMISLSEKKNADYTGGEGVFSNFEAVEKLGICTTEEGFLARMTDKMKRIIGYIKKGSLQVKDESIRDTLQDLANYTILLAGYLESKKEEEKLPPEKKFDEITSNKLIGDLNIYGTVNDTR